MRVDARWCRPGGQPPRALDRHHGLRPGNHRDPPGAPPAEARRAGRPCGNVGLLRRGSGPGASRRRRSALPTGWWWNSSGYQIEAAPEVAPRVGLWTTLTPDHLERHGTLDHYRAIKRSLLERSHLPILNGDDPDLQATPQLARGLLGHGGPSGAARRASGPPLDEDRTVIRDRNGTERTLLAADCLAMPGEHNRQNMMLATAAGLEIAAHRAAMEPAFRCFPGCHTGWSGCGRAGWPTTTTARRPTTTPPKSACGPWRGPLVVCRRRPVQDRRGQRLDRGTTASASRWCSTEQRGLSCGNCWKRPDTAVNCTSRKAWSRPLPLAAELARRGGCRAVLLSPACASSISTAIFEARGDRFRRCVEAL